MIAFRGSWQEPSWWGSDNAQMRRSDEKRFVKETNEVLEWVTDPQILAAIAAGKAAQRRNNDAG